MRLPDGHLVRILHGVVKRRWPSGRPPSHKDSIRIDWFSLTPTHYFNWLHKTGGCNENRLRESAWIPVEPTCASSSYPWMEFVIFSSVTMIEKCQPCYGDKDVVISQAALYSYTIWVISFLFSSFFTFFKNQFFSFFRKWVWDRKTCPILCINQKCKSKPIKY